VKHRPPGKPLLRALVRPPHTDTTGRKGWFERFAHAQPHAVRRLDLAIAGWPRHARSLRIAFLSDFHAGSHTGDVARIAAIVEEEKEKRDAAVARRDKLLEALQRLKRAS